MPMYSIPTRVKFPNIRPDTDHRPYSLVCIFFYFYHCVCQRPAARNAINTVWLDCTAEPSPRTDGLGRSPRPCVPCARGLGSAVKSNLTVFVAYVRRYTSIGLYWLPGDLAAAAKLLYDRARSADSQLSCRNRWCFASSSIFSSNVHTADGLEAVYFVVG